MGSRTVEKKNYRRTRSRWCDRGVVGVVEEDDGIAEQRWRSRRDDRKEKMAKSGRGCWVERKRQN